jgi:hypothetical protein
MICAWSIGTAAEGDDRIGDAPPLVAARAVRRAQDGV